MKLFWHRYRRHLAIRTDFRAIFTAPARRIPELDGLRAIGILLVMGLHSVFGASRILEEEYRGAYIAGLPGAWDIFWQARGSNLIFILCGLLVSLVLLAELDKQKTIGIKTFYQKRLMRIFPLYLAAIGLFLLVDMDNAKYLWSNLLFISNLVPDQHMIVPVGWSMDVQIQFYALLPWFLLWLSRRTHPLRWLLAIILLAPGLRYLSVMLHPPLVETPFHVLPIDGDYARLYGEALYYNLYTRITPFLIGILIAWIWHYRPALVCRWFQHAAGNTLALLTGMVLIGMAVRIGIQNPADDFYQPFDVQRNLIYLTLNEAQFSVGVCLVLLSALFPVGLSKAIQYLLSLRCWHPFSELVYGLYLFHVVGILLAALLVFHGIDRDAIVTISAVQTAMIYLLAIPLSLLLAALASLYIEKPFMRFFKESGT